MNAPLNSAQFGTLGSLKSGDHFHLPGRDGTLTVSRNDNRAGKARIMYRIGDDLQELGFVGPSNNPVDVDR